MTELEPIMHEVLLSGGEFVMKTHGTSMMPLLSDGNDGVVLVKPKGKCKKNDVVLYKRPTGQYVMHRVVAVKNGKYVMRGDSQIVNEYGVTDKMITAVMRAFFKNGERVETDSSSYRKYVRKLPLVYVLRRMKHFLKHIVGKIYKKIKVVLT